MKFWRKLIPLILSLAGALPCSAQLIAQYHPASPFIAALPGGTSWSGQTFLAGSSGQVGLVTLLGQSFGAAPASVTFQLRTVSAGLPTSTVLGTISLAGSVLNPSALSEFSADFTSLNISLNAGDQYAILLSSSSTIALGGSNDGYAGGQQILSNNGGSTFGAFAPARDLYFTVALAASPVPEPSTYGIFGAVALVGVAAFARRRAGSR